MASPTRIIVGIALGEDSPEWRDAPRGMKAYPAGYEHHEEGPSGVLGYQVKSTWNDAIDLDQFNTEIRHLKARFHEVTSKDAQVWVIGHQT